MMNTPPRLQTIDYKYITPDGGFHTKGPPPMDLHNRDGKPFGASAMVFFVPADRESYTISYVSLALL